MGHEAELLAYVASSGAYAEAVSQLLDSLVESVERL